jgi:hypothetical protein
MAIAGFGNQNQGIPDGLADRRNMRNIPCGDHSITNSHY